jgi:hypothetical protein
MSIETEKVGNEKHTGHLNSNKKEKKKKMNRGIQRFIIVFTNIQNHTLY